MKSEKNDNILNNICSISVKAVKKTDLIPDFTQVYSTFSKTSVTVTAKRIKNDIEYKVAVKQNFPGLNEDNFSNFHELLLNTFILKIHFSNGDSLLLGCEDVPLILTTDFKAPEGFGLKYAQKTFKPPVYLKNGINTSVSSGLGVYETGVFDLNIYE